MAKKKRLQHSAIDPPGAALLALCAVVAVCLLLLCVVLPLRARRAAMLESAPPAGAVSPSEMPATTPAPSPSPAPSAPSELVFEADANAPLPRITDRLARGASYQLGGTVRSSYPLLSVTVSIDCDYNMDLFYPYAQTVTFDPADAVYAYSLTGDQTQEGAPLSSLVDFSALHTGVHTLDILTTSTAQTTPVLLCETRFYVLSERWERFEKADFNNNSYATALAFFGDEERFLYRYQHVHARYTVADPDWENEYIVSFDAIEGGEPWRIHRDALPWYRQAAAYLGVVHARVSGTNGDSGVLPLTALIDTYNGSYLSRFTSSQKYVSHHAFGTATDLNGGMGVNDNTAENDPIIADEVGNKLAYNGIKEENGVSYYDFTYSGDSLLWTFRGIPETIINYLLYELAFYRAGFQWGYYYVSTSDAMHFTLTDNIRLSHDGSDGLRKVFAYSETFEREDD